MRRIFSIFFLLVNSIGALAGGVMLMAAPDGSTIQLSIHFLDHSPFHDYFYPGLALFLANGVFGIATLLLIAFKSPLFPKMIFLQGCLLAGWIIIQMIMIRFIHPFQFIFLSIAFFLIVSGI